MEIVPSVRVTRFEQLEPGDLFVYPHARGSCFALKTAKLANSDRNCIVLLGPHFPYESEESHLLSWDSVTVISYGRDYSILLPDNPDSWFMSGSLRNSVCIAIHDESAFVCTNGGVVSRGVV